MKIFVEDTPMAKQLHSGLAAVIVAAAGVVAVPSVSASTAMGDRPGTSTAIANADDALNIDVLSKASRVSQCNSLVRVVNQGQTSVSAIRNKPPSVATMNELASTLTRLAQNVMQVRVADTNLQRYRNRFSQLYGNLAGASRQVVSALTTLQRIQQQPANQRDPDALRQLQAQIADAKEKTDQVAVQERQLVNAVNSYC